MIERAPRAKKGHAAQSTTGVAKTNSIQAIGPGPRARRTGIPGSRSDIEMSIRGSVSPTLTQKRRVISRSSGSGSAAIAVTRGCRAIPQIGQAPGWSLTISGSIGQKYSVAADFAGDVVAIGRGADGCVEAAYLDGSARNRFKQPSLQK